MRRGRRPVGWYWQLVPTARHSVRHSFRSARRHYDLGSDFYRLWLDGQLVYTCAYFPSPETASPAHRVAGDGLLLAGDAAAVESGLIAAEVLLAAHGRYTRSDLEPYGEASLRSRPLVSPP